jgi:hypothetical protein
MLQHLSLLLLHVGFLLLPFLGWWWYRPFGDNFAVLLLMLLGRNAARYWWNWWGMAGADGTVIQRQVIIGKVF